MLPWSWLVYPGLHSCGPCNNSDGSTITNTEKWQARGTSARDGWNYQCHAKVLYTMANGFRCTSSLVLPARSQKVESLHLSPWLSRKESPFTAPTDPEQKLPHSTPPTPFNGQLCRQVSTAAGFYHQIYFAAFSHGSYAD
jgi:hypothetical protein